MVRFECSLIEGIIVNDKKLRVVAITARVMFCVTLGVMVFIAAWFTIAALS